MCPKLNISVEKKYILGKKYYIFYLIYTFSTDMCPKSTKKCARPLWEKLHKILTEGKAPCQKLDLKI